LQIDKENAKVAKIQNKIKIVGVKGDFSKTDHEKALVKLNNFRDGTQEV